MHIDRDHTADLMRNELLDNLSRDGLMDGIADRFINAATTLDPDPIEHPLTYRAAHPEQQVAIDLIMAGIKRYITHSRMDDVHVDRRARLDMDDAA